MLVTDDFDLLDPKLAADTSGQLLHDGTSVSAFVDVQNPGIAIAKKMVHGMRTVTPMRIGVLDHAASYFADQTGGSVIQVQNGDYLAALQRLPNEVSDAYLIGFAPPSSELDSMARITKSASP